MIKFKHAGKDYAVSFFRGEKSVYKLKRTPKEIIDGKEHFFLAKNHSDGVLLKDGNLKYTRTVTGARIKVRDGDVYKTVAAGLSVCSPQDKFSAGEGRKRAIANALRRSKDAKTAQSTGRFFPGSTESFRIELWEAYFKQCKDGQLKNGQRISAICSSVTAGARRQARRRARHK